MHCVGQFQTQLYVKADGDKYITTETIKWVISWTKFFRPTL
jgi:hypothetical protein